MLDARKIYRKVTQKINDFSPEQLQNFICIVNLYRGKTDKFNKTVKSYLSNSFENAKETAKTTTELQTQFKSLHKTVKDFASKLYKENKDAKTFLDSLTFEGQEEVFAQQNNLISSVKILKEDYKKLEDVSHQCKNLKKPQDKLIKQLFDSISNAAKELQLNKNKDWKDLNIKDEVEKLKDIQKLLSVNPDEEEPGLIHETEYYWKQAHWLKSRFPEGKYKDVEGLCKVVNQKEIKDKDWSLSPGRYVGVDTSTTDDDIDYEERLKDIHNELKALNEDANLLAKDIEENFKEIDI